MTPLWRHYDVIKFWNAYISITINSRDMIDLRFWSSIPGVCNWHNKKISQPKGGYLRQPGRFWGLIYIYRDRRFLIKFSELSFPKPQIVEIRSDQGSIANRWYCVLVDLSSQKIVTWLSNHVINATVLKKWVLQSDSSLTQN